MRRSEREDAIVRSRAGRRIVTISALVIAALLIWAAFAQPVGDRVRERASGRDTDTPTQLAAAPQAPAPEGATPYPPTEGVGPAVEAVVQLARAILPSAYPAPPSVAAPTTESGVPEESAAPQSAAPAVAALMQNESTAYPEPAAETPATPTVTLTPAQEQTIPAEPTPTELPTPEATETPWPTPTPRPPLPTPTPIPQPTPTVRYSNIGPYLLMSPEFGQPTHNLLRDGHMRAYMAVNPVHWGSPDKLPHMEGYGRNWIKPESEIAIIERGAEGARDYFNQFAGAYEASRADIHAWMSTWAYRYHDAAFADRWVEFQREWLRLMHENGYTAGIGGMRTHMFSSGEFRRLAPAIADADYLFLSEAGAPTIRESFNISVLKYRALREELKQVLSEEQIPPFILDICVDGRVLKELNRPGGPWQKGYRDYDTSKEAYAADVRAYDRETLKDPYVKHVFWFATNITQDTQSFDVNTPMLAVANGWHVSP